MAGTELQVYRTPVQIVVQAGNVPALELDAASGQTGNMYQIVGPNSTKIFQVDVNGNVTLGDGTNAGGNLKLNGTQSGSVSATAVATGASGTIATANLGVSRVNPAAARTACVLQAGTIDGQVIEVVNEAAAAFSITFDVAATSNVADGVNIPIPGLTSRVFRWDNAKLLWYGQGLTTINASITQTAGTLNVSDSATAVATGAAGTIATTTTVSRVSPAAARVGCILAAGTVDGQLCLVVNEAVAGNSVQFDVAATSNVADGITAVIPGLSSRLFVWDNAQTKWFTQELNDAVFPVGAVVSTTLVNGNTIGTNAPIMRVTNGGAVTGIIIAVGTVDGQRLRVVNEGSGSVTFAVVATSHVAHGVTAVIPVLAFMDFVWMANVVTPAWFGTL